MFVPVTARQRWRVILLFVASLTGCGRLSSQPLAVAYRESILGQGLVLVITNASPDITLIHLGLRADLPGAGRREVLLKPSVAPGETVEAGWLELRQRGDSSAAQSAIVPGMHVEIFARGYALPIRLTVPAWSR